MLTSPALFSGLKQGHDHARFGKGIEKAQDKLAQQHERLARRMNALAAGEAGQGRLRGGDEAAPADFGRAAKKLVRGAVRSMMRDVKGLFRSMGLDKGAARELARAFAQPVKQALKSGADFTAKIAVAAMQKTTVVTGAGVNQSVSLVARSLEVTVNHTTGEVAIDMQSLSVEQNVSLGFAGGSLPPASPSADDGGELTSLLEELLAGGKPTETTAETPPGGATAREGLGAERFAGERDDDDDNDDEVEGIGGRHDPEALRELIDDDDDDDDDDEGAGATRFALRDVEQFHNSLGQFLTRIRMDAALPLQPAIESDSRIAELIENRFRSRFELSA